MEFSGLLINAFRRRVFFLVFVLYYFWLKMQKFLQSKFNFSALYIKKAKTQKVSAVQIHFSDLILKTAKTQKFLQSKLSF